MSLIPFYFQFFLSTQMRMNEIIVQLQLTKLYDLILSFINKTLWNNQMWTKMRMDRIKQTQNKFTFLLYSWVDINYINKYIEEKKQIGDRLIRRFITRSIFSKRKKIIEKRNRKMELEKEKGRWSFIYMICESLEILGKSMFSEFFFNLQQ